MRITKQQILQTTADMADQGGLAAVSLKAVAAALGICTPSLYNHIASLDGLLREVAHTGMRAMNEQMAQAAIGVAGDAALRAAGVAYLRFAAAHPGVYEAIQWACWHQSEETTQILSDYHALVQRLVRSCTVRVNDMTPLVRLLAGFLHGYISQQLGEAMRQPDEAEAGLLAALDIVLLGIHQRYGGPGERGRASTRKHDKLNA